MKCPICNTETNSIICSNCGYDMTWYIDINGPGGGDPPPPPRKKARKGLLLLLTVTAFVLALLLFLWMRPVKDVPDLTVPSESAQVTDPTETLDPDAWRDNVLRSDEIPEYYEGELSDYTVFGSKYQRKQILSITVLDSLADQPEDAWDVSEAGNDSVMAWVKPNGDFYDLYLAAEGGMSAGLSCKDLFAEYEYVVSITLGDNFHTSGVKDMSGMFSWCSSLTRLTLGEKFDASNVRDMSEMFSFCESLKELTLCESFNTSSVQNMNSMFHGCTSLKKLILGDSFDTSNVVDMSYMFSSCVSLADLNVGKNFETSCVQDMRGMFTNCKELADLSFIEKFDTVSVQYMSAMFHGCSALKKLVLGNGFDTSNVLDMSYMFSSCVSLEELALSDKFDTSKVRIMREMFADCKKLTALTLSNSFSFEDAEASDMFRNCPAGNDYINEPVPTEPPVDPNRWQENILRADLVDDGNGDGDILSEEVRIFPVFGSKYRRNQISSVTILDTLNDMPADAWDVSEAGNGSVMAWVEKNGKLYDLYIGAEGGMAANETCAYLFAGYTKATSISFNGAFHTEGTENMERMFMDCFKLKELTLDDIFDTSNVQSMRAMFYNCRDLSSLTLGDNFYTYNVQTMRAMFFYCRSLTSLNLGQQFDTYKVLDMDVMFQRCKSLTELNLSDNFVTNKASTRNMFDDCPAGAEYQHLLK